MKLLIIIYTHHLKDNGENLERCLASCSHQKDVTLDYRVIIIDNNSTFSIKKKLLALTEKYNFDFINLTTFEKIPQMIDQVLKRYQPQYFTVIGSEDYISKDYIKQLYNRIFQKKNILGVCGRYRIINQKAKSNKVFSYQDSPIPFGALYNRTLFERLRISNPEFCLSHVYKKILGEKVNFYYVHNIVYFHSVADRYNKAIKNTKVSLLLTIKNRVIYWNRTFPSLVQQKGIPYEIVIVDFYSEDEFPDKFHNYILSNYYSFSPYLQNIRMVRTKNNLAFSSCKAKNLGTKHTTSNSLLLAFTDIDVVLREDYLVYWADRILKNKNSFFSSRYGVDRRISPEINYGNMLVYRNHVFKIKGHNETIKGYGGDDDEFMHRLKNLGLKEINPLSREECRLYSFLHDNEERMNLLEKKGLSGLQNWAFLRKQNITWTKDNWGNIESIIIDYKFH